MEIVTNWLKKIESGGGEVKYKYKTEQKVSCVRIWDYKKISGIKARESFFHFRLKYRKGNEPKGDLT